MKNSKQLLIAFFVAACLVALTIHDVAGQNLVRDTSYTVNSTLKKIKDLYPHLDISPALSGQVNNIVSEKDIVYREIESRKLTVNLFYPANRADENIPAVLMIHGGGWRTGDKSLMTPMAERLAQAGYFAIAAEYRLSPEAKYPAAVEDLYAAIVWLCDHAEKFNIDKNRVTVMGCSAGGQLAALVGATYNKPTVFIPSLQRVEDVRIAAVIDIDGLLAFKHPDSKEGASASQWLGGTYEEVPEIWEQASALTHADEHTPPTLFLASKYPRFLAGRQQYIAKLDSFKIKSVTYFLDDAPHSFWLLHPWFEPTVRHVLTFLSEVNK